MALMLAQAGASPAVTVLASSMAPISASPRRLHFNGSVISAPETPTVPLFLRGFNLDYQLGHGDLHMPNVTAQDRSMTTLLPGTTLVRLVMVHWHDEGTTKSGHDCSSDDPSTGFLLDVCLQQFDRVLRWATQEAGLWAIVTMRASLAAGDGGANKTLFDNATLAGQATGLWRFLASRYRSWDNVAGFEVLSEPRTELPASAVHAYQERACEAVWSSDPLTACVVGPTKFYDRYDLGKEYLLPGKPRVICAPLWGLHPSSSRSDQIRHTDCSLPDPNLLLTRLRPPTTPSPLPPPTTHHHTAGQTRPTSLSRRAGSTTRASPRRCRTARRHAAATSRRPSRAAARMPHALEPDPITEPDHTTLGPKLNLLCLIMDLPLTRSFALPMPPEQVRPGRRRRRQRDAEQGVALAAATARPRLPAKVRRARVH